MQRFQPRGCHLKKFMLTRFFSIVIFIFLLFAAGCSKEHLQSPDCNKLKDAILAGNPDEVENEINKACATLPDPNDSKNDLTRLAATISGQCNINAVVLCYNCIYTSPAQSEIKISISSAGIQKDKIIDISFTSDNKFVFAGMHD